MQDPPSFVDQLARATWPELETLWQDALRDFLSEIGAPDEFDQAAQLVRDHAFTRSLEVDWITLPSKAREDRYARLLEVLQEAGYATRPFCTRCGACCEGGSPSLHAEDLRLFSEGIVRRDQVYTLRAGQRVRLPVDLGTMVLKDEAIKLREAPESGHCIFYDAGSKECGIYHDRPLQCRAQACWDLADVQKVIRRGKKLSRADVVAPDEPVAPALVAHESHCSLVGLAEAFEDVAHGREDGLEVIYGALSYDAEIRSLLAERLPLPEGELEFYFGRPLAQVVRQFGVDVVPDGDGYRLEPRTRPEGDASE